jgi:type II secretory pathway pseudopilin PulG
MKGLTLLELVIVLFLMTLSIFLIAQTFGNNPDQKRYERTLESMQEIKKAILGTYSERVRGDIRFAGYVPDMGDLPELIDGQPRGLWTGDVKDTPDDDSDDFPYYKKYKISRKLEFSHSPVGTGPIRSERVITIGWQGPYIKPPVGGVFRDSWGTPIIFKKNAKDFIIKSLGADGKQGGKNYDKDIILVINEKDYLAQVAGYIRPLSLYSENRARVDIYYEVPEDISSTDILDFGDKGGKHMNDVKVIQDNGLDDGYFCFDGVPIGTERLLAVTQPRENGTALDIYKIDIEPGINWLGNMGNIP